MSNPTISGMASAVALPIDGGALPVRFFSNTLGTETVKVHVGPDNMVFNIHAKPLATKAARLADMLEQENGEGVRILKLPNVDPKTFDLFVNWMYNNELPSSVNDTGLGLYATVTERLEVALFAQQYNILALFTGVTSFFQFYLAGREDVPSIQDIAMVYRNSTSGSNIRDWMINSLYFRLCMDYPPLTPEDIAIIGSSPEIVTDLLIAIQGRTTPTPFAFDVMYNAGIEMQ